MTPRTERNPVPRPLALVLAALAATAACSSGSPSPVASAPTAPAPSLPAAGSAEPAGLPDGFATYDGGSYTFGYPQEWDLVERQGANGPLVVAEGPVTPAGLPQQFIVATQADYAGDLALVVNAFDFLRTLPDQQVLRDEQVAFPGAREAQVTVRTFTAPTPDGQAPARVEELRLLTPGRLLVATSARTSAADFAGSPLPAVAGSLRLRDAAPAPSPS